MANNNDRSQRFLIGAPSKTPPKFDSTAGRKNWSGLIKSAEASSVSIAADTETADLGMGWVPPDYYVGYRKQVLEANKAILDNQNAIADVQLQLDDSNEALRNYNKGIKWSMTPTPGGPLALPFTARTVDTINEERKEYWNLLVALKAQNDRLTWRVDVAQWIPIGVKAGAVTVEDVLKSVPFEGINSQDSQFIQSLLDGMVPAVEGQPEGRSQAEMDEFFKALRTQRGDLSTFLSIDPDSQTTEEILAIWEEASKFAPPSGMTPEIIMEMLKEFGWNEAEITEELFDVGAEAARYAVAITENTNLRQKQTEDLIGVASEDPKWVSELQQSKLRSALSQPALTLLIPFEYWYTYGLTPLIGHAVMGTVVPAFKALGTASAVLSQAESVLHFQESAEAFVGDEPFNPSPNYLGSGFVNQWNKNFENARDPEGKGQNYWVAAGTAWREWDGNGVLKFATEVALDPLNLLGFGIIPKLIKPLPYLGRFASAIGAFERGYVTAADWPFRKLRSAYVKHMPRTIDQHASSHARAAWTATKTFLEATAAVMSGTAGRRSLGTLRPDEMIPMLKGAADHALDNPEAHDVASTAGKFIIGHQRVTTQEMDDLFGRLRTGIVADVRLYGELNDALTFTKGFGVTRVLTSDETVDLITSGVLGSAGTVGQRDVVRTWLNEIQEGIRSRAYRRVEGDTPESIIKNIQQHVKDDFIRATKSDIYIDRYQGGIINQTLSQVDAMTKMIWTDTIEKHVVKPISRSYLVFLGYGVYNVIERGIATALAGVNPMWYPVGKPGTEATRAGVYFHGSGAYIPTNVFFESRMTLEAGELPVDSARQLSQHVLLSSEDKRAAMRNTSTFFDMLLNNKWMKRATLFNVAADVGSAQNQHYWIGMYKKILQERHPEIVQAVDDMVSRVFVDMDEFVDSKYADAFREDISARLLTGDLDHVRNVTGDLTVDRISAMEMSTVFEQLNLISAETRDYVTKLSASGELWRDGPAGVNRIFNEELTEMLYQRYFESPRLIADMMEEFTPAYQGWLPSNLTEYHLQLNALGHAIQDYQSSIGTSIRSANAYTAQIDDNPIVRHQFRTHYLDEQLTKQVDRINQQLDEMTQTFETMLDEPINVPERTREDLMRAGGLTDEELKTLTDDVAAMEASWKELDDEAERVATAYHRLPQDRHLSVPEIDKQFSRLHGIPEEAVDNPIAFDTHNAGEAIYKQTTGQSDLTIKIGERGYQLEWRPTRDLENLDPTDADTFTGGAQRSFRVHRPDGDPLDILAFPAERTIFEGGEARTLKYIEVDIFRSPEASRYTVDPDVVFAPEQGIQLNQREITEVAEILRRWYPDAEAAGGTRVTKAVLDPDTGAELKPAKEGFQRLRFRHKLVNEEDLIRSRELASDQLQGLERARLRSWDRQDEAHRIGVANDAKSRGFSDEVKELYRELFNTQRRITQTYRNAIDSEITASTSFMSDGGINYQAPGSRGRDANWYARLEAAQQTPWRDAMETANELIYGSNGITAMRNRIDNVSGINTTSRGLPIVEGNRLSTLDVANLMGTTPADLSNNMYLPQLMALRGKDEFVTMVRGQAEIAAQVTGLHIDDTAFTREGISDVYDNIVFSLRDSKAIESSIEPAFLQLDSARQAALDLGIRKKTLVSDEFSSYMDTQLSLLTEEAVVPIYAPGAVRKRGGAIAREDRRRRAAELTQSIKASEKWLEQAEKYRGQIQNRRSPLSREVSGAAEPAADAPSPKLPRDLKGGDPRYGLGGRLFTVEFKDDLDKALYIVARADEKSSRDADYLKWIRDKTGLDEDPARARGMEVRERIKRQAQDAAPDVDNLVIERTGGAVPITPAAEGVTGHSPLAERISRFLGREFEPGTPNTQFQSALSRSIYERSDALRYTRREAQTLSEASMPTPAEERAIGREALELEAPHGLVEDDEVLRRVLTPEWQDDRDSVIREISQRHNLDFPNYDEGTALTSFMKSIFPFWTYEAHRWAWWMPRETLRHPGLYSDWGKYEDNTDTGYMHIPNSSLDINPIRGTIWMGGLRRLIQRDYPEYYDQFPAVSETLDYLSRFGFYPGPHISGSMALFGAKYGAPQFGAVLPPMVKTIGETLVTFAPRTAGRFYQNLFPDQFRDFNIAREISSMGFEGMEMLHKRTAGTPFTREEDDLWRTAAGRLGPLTVMMEQTGLLRIRHEDRMRVFDEANEVLAEGLGVNKSLIVDIRRQGLKIEDTLGAIPPETHRLINMVEGYSRWVGGGITLGGTEDARLQVIQREFWDLVSTQRETELNNLRQTESLVRAGLKTMDDWMNENRDAQERLSGLITSVRESSPRYENVPITLDERIAYAQEHGFVPPALHLIEELRALYFDYELKEKYDYDSGTIQPDYDGLFLYREAIERALPDDQIERLRALNEADNTEFQQLFYQVNREYIRPYNQSFDVVLSEFPAEEQKIIKEFRTLVGEPERREELQSVLTEQTEGFGRGVVSLFNERLRIFHQNLRDINPELDAWLLFYGKVDTPRTDAAETRLNQIRQSLGFK